MALVTDAIRRAEIPHEPGEWMDLARLSWRQQELATEVASQEGLKRLKALGGDLLKALRDFGKEQDEKPEAKYDRGFVLEAGIVKWSYEAKVNKENIDALDEQTADWAFLEILQLNAPRTEEEQKNA